MGADGQYNPIGSSSDVTMVNSDQYNSALEMFKNGATQYGNQFNQYTGQAADMFGQISSLSGNYDNFIKQIMGQNGQGGLIGELGDVSKAYDPEAGFRLFLSQNPQLQNVIQDMARTSLSESGASARQLAEVQSQASLNDTASQLAASGLLGAGAGTSAMTQAAMAPRLAQEAALASTRANYLSTVGGGLTSQLMSGSQSAYDAQQQMLMQGILGKMQGVGQAGDMLGNRLNALGGAAAGYGGLAGNYGSLLGESMAGIGGLSQPEYWQPQYEKMTSSGDKWGAGLTGGLAGLGTGAAIAAALGLTVASGGTLSPWLLALLAGGGIAGGAGAALATP